MSNLITSLSCTSRKNDTPFLHQTNICSGALGAVGQLDEGARKITHTHILYDYGLSFKLRCKSISCSANTSPSSIKDTCMLEQSGVYMVDN